MSAPEGPLRIEYVRLDDVVRYERNAKRHDIGGMIQSIRTHGFRDASILDGTLGAVAAGNGRLTALLELRAIGPDGTDAAWPPEGVVEDPDGAWWVPLQVGIDAPDVATAEGFMLDHNILTLGGSGLSFAQAAGMFDRERLEAVLADSRARVTSVRPADIEALLSPATSPAPREYGPSTADGVPMATCPNCHETFPR